MSHIHPARHLAAKTSAQRQADLRRRREDEGRKQTPFWLTAEEKARVKAFLAGGPAEDATQIAAQRDELATQLDTTLKANRDLRTELARLHDDWREAVHDLQEVRRQLAKAEQALSAKPAKTFKVPELPDRRALIISAMSTEESWRGGTQEMDTYKIEQQAALAKKFATEIRQARSRLAGLVEITSGEKLLEQSKTATVFGGYNRFKSPLISPAEKALLQEACAVIGRFERDVELAGRDVANLHKQRAAEDKARLEAASAALDATLFKGLDRRGEALFVAAVEKDSSWGPWRDLVRLAKGKEAPSSWNNAAELFRKALDEAKGYAARRVSAEMKAKGIGPERPVDEIVQKYRHPDTAKSHGATADLVTAFLVSEQLSKAK